MFLIINTHLLVIIFSMLTLFYLISNYISFLLKGLLNMMKTPTFVFHLFIFHEVLKIINILSKQLQQKNTNLSNATNTINGVIKTFEEMRNIDHFSGIWDKISNFASKNDISLDIPKSN